MSKLIATQLTLNGWVAVLIGSFIVFEPVNMLSGYGLQPNLSPALMSELRSPGGLLFACGLVIAHSALAADNYERGLKLSTMVYGGYGITRLLSIVVDGEPAVDIMLAAAIEIALLLLSGLALLKLNRNPDAAYAN
ncbi:MAG: DUF4345 domain-containing protein [Gammaproteobacteria bacterium]